MGKYTPFLCAALSIGTLISCGQNVLVAIPLRQEEYKQNAASKVDVLWVVDNSQSMAEEQAGLGQSFQTFIDTLTASQVDYHIGIISTDTSTNGQLNKPSGTAFIRSDTPDPKNTFVRNVSVGIQGSRLEMGFASAAMAVGQGTDWSPGRTPTPPRENQGFIRPEASLFIIMVSDEDDKSFGPVGYYSRLFESYKGAGNESLVSVSAIIGPTDQAANKLGCFDAHRGSAMPGFRYAELAAQTGGIVTSICSDFNESLGSLSLTAAGLRAVFPLNGHPDRYNTVACPLLKPQPICVTVNGVAVVEAQDGAREGWLYDEARNAIVFEPHSIPPPQAAISISFKEVAL